MYPRDPAAVAVRETPPRRSLKEALGRFLPLSRDTAGVPLGRDARLDMFRGLALVMIFINHVPGTLYENFTNRNFGFSDAAEAFVFMSGMAAGLAYSTAFLKERYWVAAARVLARARQLYFVHLTITAIALAMFAAAALWFGLPDVLETNGISVLFDKTPGALVGLPLMTYQLGYLNILPLYIVLLAVTPLLLPLGLRHPYLLVAGSLVVWAVVGVLQVNFPNFPGNGGWFLNPFAWQLLFVVGLLCGAAMKQKRSFVPFNPMLFGFAAALVIFIALWMRIPAIGAAGRSMLGEINDLGLPDHFTWFNKSYLDLPRMVHAFALFYVLSSLTLIRHFAASRYAAPFRLLGRFGLPVFATGTLLSLFGQILKSERQPDPVFDGILLATGLLLLLALAKSLDITTQMRRESVAAKASATAATDG
ncbi:OpgC protein [Devosia pacifica]|uniref:OpgC protein n=1 Tax=Devosia pacifica TaxID=1335967 RepID=A0A918VTE2_9HYPH|nr:OpgC domain-containing protein [Devosia pacifica]GHA22188.1 OpgC protein [Devosia pacifica]